MRLEDIKTRDLIIAQIPALRRYAHALVRPRDKVEDVLQETLLKALAAERQWQPGTNMRAWLFTILHNIYMGQVRRHMRRPAHISIEGEALNIASSPSQITNVALREFERNLAALPEGQRATLLLVFLEGLSYQEAAEMLCIPIGTVRSRLARARRALYAAMGSPLDEAEVEDSLEDMGERADPASGAGRAARSSRLDFVR